MILKIHLVFKYPPKHHGKKEHHRFKSADWEGICEFFGELSTTPISEHMLQNNVLKITSVHSQLTLQKRMMKLNLLQSYLSPPSVWPTHFADMRIFWFIWHLQKFVRDLEHLWSSHPATAINLMQSLAASIVVNDHEASLSVANVQAINISFNFLRNQVFQKCVIVHFFLGETLQPSKLPICEDEGGGLKAKCVSTACATTTKGSLTMGRWLDATIARTGPWEPFLAEPRSETCVFKFTYGKLMWEHRSTPCTENSGKTNGLFLRFWFSVWLRDCMFSFRRLFSAHVCSLDCESFCAKLFLFVSSVFFAVSEACLWSCVSRNLLICEVLALYAHLKSTKPKNRKPLQWQTSPGARSFGFEDFKCRLDISPKMCKYVDRSKMLKHVRIH